MFQHPSLIIKKASGVILLAFSLYSGINAQQISSLKNINSAYDEQHPQFSPAGELFFSIGFHPQNTGGPTDFGDIWVSSRDSQGNWQSPKRVEGLSTQGNDVVVGFTDGLTVLVYHSGSPSMKQGIHMYSRFGSSWNYLRPLDIANFKNNSAYFSGRLSHDGEVIVMAMASYGTYGNEDIYISIRKDDGSWTAPLNLGSGVNTFAQEQTPYLSPDNMTLYFSSNVHGNGRGKDIYFVQRTGSGWEDWSEATLVQGVNSQGSEMSYVSYGPNPSMAIFSTTQNSEGFGDFMLSEFLKVEPITVAQEMSQEPALLQESATIAEELKAEIVVVSEEVSVPVVEAPKEVPAEKIEASIVEQTQVVRQEADEADQPAYVKKDWISVKVVDASTKSDIGYQLEIANERGIKKPIQSQVEWQAFSEDPQWTSILVHSKGYIPQLLTKGEWELLQGEELMMKPALAGASIVLENIQFNRGTSDFADSKSIQVLDNLVSFMKENPSIKIRLEGHTDNAGDPSLNKDLSMKRASKIRGYLTINGVDFERVRISGWGGNRPIADNNTEEGRERNRRVEMLIENL